VFVHYLAKLEKFTWKQDEGNNVLWTSIFPFSFAFPLVLPRLLLFLATGICVFFCLPSSSELDPGYCSLKEIKQSLSSVSISLCYPVLTRVSCCFLFLFFLFSFFLCSPSAPPLYSSPLYSLLLFFSMFVLPLVFSVLCAV